MHSLPHKSQTCPFCLCRCQLRSVCADTPRRHTRSQVPILTSAASGDVLTTLLPPGRSPAIAMARLLQLFIFACALATALALGSLPDATAPPSAINLAQASSATAPAKPFFDPLLMYNPYMCVPSPPALTSCALPVYAASVWRDACEAVFAATACLLLA